MYQRELLMNKSDTEKGNKVVKKEPAQKKTTQKRPMGNRSRVALLLVSLVAVIGGLIVAGVGTKTKKVKQESNVFTYQVNTTSSYQVVLKNNSIYDTPTLEEGRVYSDALTDHIAVQLKSELVGDQAATLHVDYDINAELDGFFNNDPTKKVYSKVQNLKHVSTEPTQDGRVTVEESVDVSPDLFAGFVTEAEKELGSTTSKSMSLVLSGKYYIDVNGQQQTKDFTYTLPMPIRGANKLYTVDKPDAAADSGSITNSTLVKERLNQKLTPVGVVLLVIGLGMGVSVLVLTKAPDEREAIGLAQKEVVRKQRSHLVNVRELPDFSGRMLVQINDIEDMISLSEEMGSPILCALDENDVPKDGKFLILSDTTAYFLKN